MRTAPTGEGPGARQRVTEGYRSRKAPVIGVSSDVASPERRLGERIGSRTPAVSQAAIPFPVNSVSHRPTAREAGFAVPASSYPSEGEPGTTGRAADAQRTLSEPYSLHFPKGLVAVGALAAVALTAGAIGSQHGETTGTFNDEVSTVLAYGPNPTDAQLNQLSYLTVNGQPTARGRQVAQGEVTTDLSIAYGAAAGKNNTGEATVQEEARVVAVSATATNGGHEPIQLTAEVGAANTSLQGGNSSAAAAFFGEAVKDGTSFLEEQAAGGNVVYIAAGQNPKTSS